MLKIRLIRKRATFALVIERNKNGVQQKFVPIVQFTTKDMWLLPKHEDTAIRNLWGWLFFYFGYIHTNRKMF